MIVNFKHLRPPANYPVYPPYHKGLYLEEYFYNFYKANKTSFDKTGYTLIPIFWTNIYNTNLNRHLIQPYLDVLPAGKYFTVSQHDDAVTERLPEGTISFEAGGNKNGIPIPLICSQINKSNGPDLYRQILCSFVGSINTNPLRETIYNTFYNDTDFVFSTQQWCSAVSNNRLDTFIDITSRSIFSLCPRGYGAQSFRIYEVMQLGAIPVIVYDKEWFPFSDFIDWNTFAVLIHTSEIKSIKEKLLSKSKQEVEQMLEVGKHVYNTMFTMEGVSKQILKFLEK